MAGEPSIEFTGYAGEIKDCRCLFRSATPLLVL